MKLCDRRVRDTDHPDLHCWHRTYQRFEQARRRTGHFSRRTNHSFNFDVAIELIRHGQYHFLYNYREVG